MDQRPKHQFASDNTAGLCPEAIAALEQSNPGAVAAYGEDEWTAKLCRRVREIFENDDCEVYLVFNGTAANALALAQLARPFESVLCHRQAHIETDECGAPEFFTSGSKLITIGGMNGKLDLAEAAEAIRRQPQLHAQRPRVISFAQSTELGTVYDRGELESIGAFARHHDLRVHVDGARFANAVIALECAPKDIIAGAKVDVLCLGGTKNGLAAGELVIFFGADLARQFDYRLKQAGQLASKMRFLAAPWLALLTKDIWLRNARNANAMAIQLSHLIGTRANLQIALPVEANALFVRMDQKQVGSLNDRGWHFYRFIEPDIYRFMCSWSTTQDDLDRLMSDLDCIE